MLTCNGQVNFRILIVIKFFLGFGVTKCWEINELVARFILINVSTIMKLKKNPKG